MQEQATAMSLREVGRALGISAQYVYRVEQRALAKLRRAVLEDPVLRQHLTDDRHYLEPEDVPCRT